MPQMESHTRGESFLSKRLEGISKKMSKELVYQFLFKRDSSSLLVWCNCTRGLTRYKENGQNGVVLHTASIQVQIRDQAERLRVGDVDAVQESEQIQQADKREQVGVDSRHEFLLGGVRRAGDAQLINAVLVLVPVPVPAAALVVGAGR